MSDKQEQSTNDVPSNQANNQAKWRDVWLTEDDVKGKTAFVDTSSGKSLTHIKLSEVLNAKYGPPSDFEQRIRDECAADFVRTARPQWATESAAIQGLTKQLATAQAEVERLNKCLGRGGGNYSHQIRIDAYCGTKGWTENGNTLKFARNLAEDLDLRDKKIRAKDALLREVLSVAYQTKEINRHPMLCLKEIRGMIKAKLEESK